MSRIDQAFPAVMLVAALGGSVFLQAARLPHAQPARPAAADPVALKVTVDRYCVSCHSERLKTAGLVLEHADLTNVGPQAEMWEKVVRKLQAGAMPPAGRPRPDAAVHHATIGQLQDALDRAAAKAPNPGRPASIHRLNRVEYANAIRDLLALEVDAREMLPGDNSSYGFDNIADVLTVSPGLLDRYVLVAKKISRLAVGDRTIPPSVSTYTLPYLSLVQDERMSNDLPFGTRGGIAVRHFFPAAGEYTLKITLQRGQLSNGHRLRGLASINHIDVRLDRALVTQFTVGGVGGFRGGYSDIEETEDAGLEIRFTAPGGTHVVGVTFPEDDWYIEGVGPSRLPPASDGYADGRDTDTAHGRVQMEIDKVDIAGPFNVAALADTPSRRRIFVCTPTSAVDEEPCARRILSTLARRAYRRPVTAAEERTLLDFYQRGRAGATFDAGIQNALVRILVAPKFLFRVETDPPSVAPGQVYALSDVDLASRLSFFLWSSIPDDELLDAAVRGRLKNPAVLRQQVTRMLQDERSSALLSNFFGQWLLVRNLETQRPDPKVFPDFDENLRQAFARETDLFLGAQLREDRPATELFTANYTFVNERLARHYGIPNVYGSHFRRVRFADDTRAGLLGQGSVLAVTAYNDRTSVVVRGKWILENLFGTPPPPPPPNVPPLENTRVQGSLRQRMEQHRKNPVCAACHASLDPLGFALENFDAVGAYRATDGNVPVDASGSLADGTSFNSPATFRKALMDHKDAILTTMVERLMTYALGRGVEYYDMPAARSILRASEASDYRWSSIVLALVKSEPFQTRRAEL